MNQASNLAEKSDAELRTIFRERKIDGNVLYLKRDELIDRILATEKIEAKEVKQPEPVQVVKADVKAALAAAKKEVKAKSKVPIYEADGETREIVDRLWEVKAKLDELNSMEAVLSNQLLTAIRPVRQGYFDRGELVTSLRAMGSKGGLTVTWANRYTAADADSEEYLREIVGEDFDRFFREQREIKMKDTSEAAIDLLLEKLGVDVFVEMFEVRQTIKATALWGSDVRIPENVRGEVESLGIRQAKPGIRLV